MSQRVCVFCGANVGRRAEYGEAAEALGRELARRSVTLVFGGGHVGLMGRISDTVIEQGGEAIGIIPEALQERELASEVVTRLEITPDMHTRKARMAELSDAFIALPGGMGTLEELFEVVTWAQLGFHDKPIGLLNVAGYYDSLETLVHRAVEEGFAKPAHRDLFHFETDPARLLDYLIGS